MKVCERTVATSWHDVAASLRYFCGQFFALAIAVLCCSSSASRADTIASLATGYTAGIGSRVGQSVTTPAGGAWDRISFNFYHDSVTPFARGNLYLFDHECICAPAALSTSGALGYGVASGGTTWVFDQSLTLQQNTRYYFYMDGFTAASVLINSNDQYPDGAAYSAFSDTDPYQEGAGSDMLFMLSGTQESSPSPIPGAGLLSYLLLGCGGAAACRRRLRAGAAAALAMLKRRTPLATAEAAG